ncbi:putative late blight resistance protein homolog R1B-16 [Salvia hispanica]|uniref:putative late blight resistance protein homolog R1B-16 n=1 Tax=Salvia hispanica TaxID=49212 RepID=UPI002009CBC5|nr:putative late blight resistance protein homolog R1B-16 [Salvia hispanica]
MAATAYASLVSLLNTMDLILIHPHLSTCFENYQLQSLREIVDFLVDFVENYSEAENLMRRVADAAHEAEDLIEVEAADRIRGKYTTKSVKMQLRRLEKMVQEMSYIKEKVIKFKEETGFVRSMRRPSPPPSSSSARCAAKKTTMLGFDRYVAQLLDELIGYDSRRILPIVGMGGIGKTTLARNVYENSLVVYHFDVRAWVTVSQEYSESDMLSQALSCLGGSSNKDDDELGEELHRTLYGRRYLIVLDDVWSVAAWEKIKSFFPENVTFAEQNCPPQLEGIAEKIVRKCRGLPLAIRVIGGLLGKSPRTQEYWEEIAKDKSLVLEYSSEGSKPSSILYMSYKHLPVWLKSCFLYLGLFPEDHKIDVSRLIKLWVAEGFIKRTKNRSLEQVAESYIKELVDRNLLLVGELTKHKKVLYYCLHDLVRELCIKTAENEDFYCLQREIDEKNQFGAPLKSRLLRVVVDDRESSLENTFKRVNLRYVSRSYKINSMSIPSSISLCWSLQTLIVKYWSPVVVPFEIWKMPQLRHIDIDPIMRLPHPPSRDKVVLHNLQTLKTVDNLILTEEACVRIPNVRELDVAYHSFEEHAELGWSFHLHNVVRLSKLESLSLRGTREQCVGNLFGSLTLPNSLTELTLDNCYIAWSGMAMVAYLPRLQLLHLKGQAMLGSEWKFVKEEFRGLKHLTISDSYELISWIADKSNFPVLETLYLLNLKKLVEIPWDIGEIPTLEKISVVNCSESARMSAIKILEEQENLGNQDLQVEIDRRNQIRGLYESPNLHFV